MSSPASAYAEELLGQLGVTAGIDDSSDPVVDWARSGAMALTGLPEGPPLVVPGPAAAARGALLALRALAPQASLPGVSVLGERAALAGLRRQGPLSCGGATRLLPAADGMVALSLARPDDHGLVPALVEDVVDDSWQAVTGWLVSTTTAHARERATLLGLPLAVVGEVTDTRPWVVLSERPGLASPVSAPVVVDLSSLWAGPLCTSLLRALGCRVLKVEDPSRPDGARRGSLDFFDLLNAGAESVAVDLRSAAGRAQLAELIARADVVVEASRPRALAQLGIVAEEVVAERDRLTWISITAYGRADGRRGGYGDDSAAAGGLVAHAPEAVFVGDAIADPLTGLHAALVGWAGVLAGGSRLVDVALSRVACAAATAAPADPRRAVRVQDRWCVETADGMIEVAAPHGRRPVGPAPRLGAGR